MSFLRLISELIPLPHGFLRRVQNSIYPYPYTASMLKYKYIFVHIPKTGGTSVLQALNAPSRRNHASWEIYREANKFYFKDFFKFTVVRHPVSRIYSSYNYILNGGNGRPADIELCRHVQSKTSTFECFILNFLTRTNIIQHSLFRPQTFFVCNFSGEPVVDHICKLETIEDDVRPVFDRLNLSFPEYFPSINSRSQNTPTLDISDRAESMIYKLYQSDFETFGYNTTIK